MSSLVMTKEYRQYRRASGMAKFEQKCGTKLFNGRSTKAYKIPGTREHGVHAMFGYDAQRQAKREGWNFYE